MVISRGSIPWIYWQTQVCWTASCKPVDTLMDLNVKLVPGQGEPLRDRGRYQRLVGKLNYFTITQPDISFPVSVVNQFL